MRPGGKTDSEVFNKFRLHCFNAKFSIHFGLVWNEMQSSLIKMDSSRNHYNGAPAHKISWVETALLPSEVNSLVKVNGLQTCMTSAV